MCVCVGVCVCRCVCGCVYFLCAEIIAVCISREQLFNLRTFKLLS